MSKRDEESPTMDLSALAGAALASSPLAAEPSTPFRGKAPPPPSSPPAALEQPDRGATADLSSVLSEVLPFPGRVAQSVLPSAPRPAPAPPASPWAGGGAPPSPRGHALPRPPSPLLGAPAPRPTPAPSVAASPAPIRAAPRLVLLWWHPDCAPRLHRGTTFRPLLDQLDRRPVDHGLDDVSPSLDPVDREDRREVFEVLARGRSAGEDGIRAAMRAGVRDDGKVAAPIVLAAGDMVTPLDELARLKITLTLVTTLPGPEDAPLSEALGSARAFLEAADPLCPPGLARRFTNRIEDALGAREQAPAAQERSEQTRRLLLENRRYERRIVFGETHLRTLLHVDGADAAMPAYLPEALASSLPLYERFAVRLLAEAVSQEDQHEAHPLALRALALARVLPPL